MSEFRILAPLGMLGYGFPEASLEAGMAACPDVIGADAGSTDGGPHKHGAGVGIVSPATTRRDLAAMLRAARRLDIPLIVGSAGGSGAEPHLDWTRAIVEEIARDVGLRFRLALIHAEVPREAVRDALRRGRVTPLFNVPPLTDATLDQTIRIVAQMGVEPIQQALRAGAQVVLAGRAYDPAVLAAVPLMRGADPGLAWHLAKILECGAQCALPGSPRDGLLGILRPDHFIVEPTNPARRCTPTSVAAHTLYEKSHPSLLPGPGGTTDLTACRFEPAGARGVRVSGSRFTPSPRYTVKLEGSALVAYRTLVIAGVRDPVFIERIDDVEKHVRAEVARYFHEVPAASYQLLLRRYGLDGVMGPLEPAQDRRPHEVGLVLEVVARTQALADTICAFARATMLHYDYLGRKATAGNLAFPHAPSDIPAGPVYRYSVYHLLEVDDPTMLFPVDLVDL